MGWETEAGMCLVGHCHPPAFILIIASIGQDENGQSLEPRAIGNIPSFPNIMSHTGPGHLRGLL